MSISRFQERFLSGGCLKVLTGGMAVVFAVGVFQYAQCGRQPGGAPNSDVSNAPAVATIGKTELRASELEDAMQLALNNQMQQFAGQAGGAPAFLPVEIEASTVASALQRVVDQAGLVELAKRNGVQFSSDSIKAELTKQFDEQLKFAKFQLESQGKLKSGSTQAEFEEAIKKETGKPIPELRTDFVTNIDGALNDPSRRFGLEAQVAQTLLMNQMKKKLMPTDAELRGGYDQYELKRILFRDEPGKSAEAQGKTVLADLQANKLNFNTAVDRFSKDSPQPKKRLSETTITLDGSSINGIESYKDLRGLKVGQTSALVKVPDGYAIYRVEAIKPNLPKDFDKEMAKYRDQAAQGRAGQALQKELDDLKAGNAVVWKDKGYEALYQYAKALSDPSTISDTPKRVEKMKEVATLAKAGLSSAGTSRAAALANYAAQSALYDSPGADRAKLREEFAQAIEDLLQTTENPDLRLRLVDVALDLKQGDRAFENLVAAAQANNSYDSGGQRIYSDVAGRVLKMKQAGLLKPDQEKKVGEEQTRWREGKREEDKAEAAAKVQQAIDRAREAQEEAKAKAEEAKAKAAEKPKPKDSNQGSSFLPPPGTP